MRTIKLCATPPVRPATLLGVIRRTAIELERNRPASSASPTRRSSLGSTKAAFA